MAILSRLFKSGWLASIALAVGLGMAALTPTPARAQDDDLVRVIVNVADVIFRGGYPYYRHGDYGYDDRLIVVRDRYGRPVYYRDVPRYAYYNNSRPPYGKAHGYWKKHRTTPRVSCDRYGRCITRYYDPRYDRRYYDRRYYDRYYGYRGSHYDDRYYRDDRYWDGYRWRYRHRDRDHDDDDD